MEIIMIAVTIATTVTKRIIRICQAFHLIVKTSTSDYYLRFTNEEAGFGSISNTTEGVGQAYI